MLVDSIRMDLSDQTVFLDAALLHPRMNSGCSSLHHWKPQCSRSSSRSWSTRMRQCSGSISCRPSLSGVVYGIIRTHVCNDWRVVYLSPQKPTHHTSVAVNLASFLSSTWQAPHRSEPSLTSLWTLQPQSSSPRPLEKTMLAWSMRRPP